MKKKVMNMLYTHYIPEGVFCQEVGRRDRFIVPDTNINRGWDKVLM